MDKQKIFPSKLIISQFIMGKPDQQRGYSQKTMKDLLPRTKLIVDSANKFNLPVCILVNQEMDYEHDNLMIKYQPSIDVLSDVSLYFERWVMSYYFLLEHPEIEEIALVDLGDVEILNNPFGHFEEDVLYVGDDNSDLNAGIILNGYIPAHVEEFLAENSSLQMLNPGFIGGKRSIIMEFLGKIVNLITEAVLDHEHGNPKLRAYDMGMINYVCYKYFANQLQHGRRVSTVFFANQTKVSSWAKHK